MKKFPAKPSPCPTLKVGLALGAPAHQGFCATWNWIVKVFKNAREHFVFSLNELTGNVKIEGDGVEIDTKNNAIKISGGGGGGGSFSYEDGRIKAGVVMVGRQAYRVGGLAATDGEYRVRITLDSSGGASCVLQQGNGFEAPNGNVSYIPVFTLSGGKITEDLRGAFVVPAYD